MIHDALREKVKPCIMKNLRGIAVKGALSVRTQLYPRTLVIQRKRQGEWRGKKVIKPLRNSVAICLLVNGFDLLLNLI